MFLKRRRKFESFQSGCPDEYYPVGHVHTFIQMKKLEKEIGVSLFERDSRRMRLTPAGEVVQKAFAAIIGSYNAMLWQARSLAQEQKCLRIGYHGPSDWAGILGLFQLFMRENPDIQLRLQSAEYGELARKLEEGQLDLAFLETSDVEGRDALKQIPLFDDYGSFVVSREHPLAGSANRRRSFDWILT